MQLKHLPTGIVVKSQATRSRTQNRKIARDLLALRLDELAHGAQSRTAVVGDVKQKRAASKAKKSRRKYKKLAEEKGQKGEKVAEEGEEEGEVEEEGGLGGEKEVGEGQVEEGGKARKVEETGTQRATVVEVEDTSSKR